MLFRGIDYFVICYHLHYHNNVSLVGLDFYYQNKLHANYTLISALIYQGAHMFLWSVMLVTNIGNQMC